MDHDLVFYDRIHQLSEFYRVTPPVYVPVLQYLSFSFILLWSGYFYRIYLGLYFQIKVTCKSRFEICTLVHLSTILVRFTRFKVVPLFISFYYPPSLSRRNTS